MPKTGNIEKSGPRQRLLDASYRLFARRGVENVGIDSILEESRCAKATLYSNFDSKLGLAIAFIDRREQLSRRSTRRGIEITRRSERRGSSGASAKFWFAGLAHQGASPGGDLIVLKRCNPMAPIESKISRLIAIAP